MRSSPEGLGKLLFEAIRFAKGKWFAACWLGKADAKYVEPEKGDRVFSLAKRFRNHAWVKLRRTAATRGTFVRVEAKVRTRKSGVQEVRGGKIVYEVEGEEKEIPITALLKVEDGTWKAFTLIRN